MRLQTWWRRYVKRRLFFIGVVVAVTWLLLTALLLPAPTFHTQFGLKSIDSSVPENIWDSSSQGDRIIAQINHIPRVFREAKNASDIPVKVIYDRSSPLSTSGDFWFHRQKCLIRNCRVSNEYDSSVDAIIIKSGRYNGDWLKSRSPDQIWIYYTLESPYHTASLSNLGSLVNWTATYRRDSTLVSPYKKWVPSSDKIDLQSQESRNYAAGKKKLVAWFVSNCNAANNRQKYAEELAKFITVDIYGFCGPFECHQRGKDTPCFDLLKHDYKFYLSFENSNCRDYVTEKFFVNALTNDVVPIALGAHKDDYTRMAPPGSFIHVDDFDSPESLATYLHELDKDDSKYNEYFKWKGTGNYKSTQFWCRLCAMLHDDEKPRMWVSDLETWWRPGNGHMCIGENSWNHMPKEELIQNTTGKSTYEWYD